MEIINGVDGHFAMKTAFLRPNGALKKLKLRFRAGDLDLPEGMENSS